MPRDQRHSTRRALLPAAVAKVRQKQSSGNENQNLMGSQAEKSEAKE
jgi:hypothetical protein